MSLQKQVNKVVRTLAKPQGKAAAAAATAADDEEEEAEEEKAMEGDEQLALQEEVSHAASQQQQLLAADSDDADGVRVRQLFRGLRVFLSREVPQDALEFVLLSGGAAVVRYDAERLEQEKDTTLTHEVGRLGCCVCVCLHVCCACMCAVRFLGVCMCVKRALRVSLPRARRWWTARV